MSEPVSSGPDGLHDARETVLAYHWALDRGEATSALQLFTESPVLQAQGKEYVGRVGVAGFLEHRESQVDRHTLHLIANEMVSAKAPDEVEMSAALLLLVRQTDGSYALEGVLETRHLVRREGGSWRIHRRWSKPLHSAGAAPSTGST